MERAGHRGLRKEQSVISPPNHFDAALKVEWLYIYRERLGMLCEDRTPTAEQLQMAIREATEHCEGLLAMHESASR